MSATQQVCPKCKFKMSEGFIVDEGYNRRFVSRWVEGPPEMGWLGLKTWNKRIIATTTYRCTSCGYFESGLALRFQRAFMPQCGRLRAMGVCGFEPTDPPPQKIKEK
jgi:hypothetical protein